MPSPIARCIRLLLIPLFVYAGFVLYGRALELFGRLIPIPQNRSLVLLAAIAPGVCVAVLIAVLFSYPLAYLYGKRAVMVALLVFAPVLVVQLPAIFDATRHPIAIAVTAYEVAAYLVLLVGGAWSAHSRLSRSNLAARSDSASEMRRQ